MPIVNQARMMIDRPSWEQVSFAPATGVAGTCMCDDTKRNIYVYFQTAATTAQFWQYDSWFDSWQQLANPPTQTGTVATIVYTPHIGGQWSGQVFGSVFIFAGNASSAKFYQYDIATNAWATKSVSGPPANWGTDAYLLFPQVSNNNWAGGYHPETTGTIKLADAAAVASTTLAVDPLPMALLVGHVLDFGVMSITLTAGAARGAQTIACSATAFAMDCGPTQVAIITSSTGEAIQLAAPAAAGATSLTVFPLIRSLVSGDVITIRRKAVLTAAAASEAESVTVAPLLCSLANDEESYIPDAMYLAGNNATQLYRYKISTDTWSTTSANSGNPAFPAILGTVGAGCAMEWLSAYDPTKIWILRGGGTATAYMYDMTLNTMGVQTYYPATETFTTGTNKCTRSIGGKQGSLLIQKDATMRIYEGIPPTSSMTPKGNQWLYPTGAAVVGNRMCDLISPDGTEFLYMLLHSSNAMVRCCLTDQ